MAVEVGMGPEVGGAGAGELDEAVRALREWQHEGAPVQLHPGDVGWFLRLGDGAAAEAVRVWRRGGETVAVGLLDGPDLLRLALAPDARRDEDVARRLTADLTDPGRGVLPEGTVYVEAPRGALVRETLADAGWEDDEPWTPLHRDLAAPVPGPGVRIEVTGPDDARVRSAVQRAAFANSAFTEDAWHAMAAAPTYADARCLVAYDERGDAVAAVTVWSAGPGRPGLLEPLGVHRDHRGRGHGRAVTLAAAAALRELGSSSAVVCTPSSNTAAVATYASAGFRRLPELRDLRRDAAPHPAAAPRPAG
ncbi:GNAT family N-acetyltransferase [Streptomyces sp. NPDC086843]|uniref:GNAT family N-acetyltransferase n=1 Tax=Streptomyces sp. NPDC086843 TaxID=3365763 RepID=UPI00382B85FC